MSNVYIARNIEGKQLARFLSRDYEPEELVEEHGPVLVYDQSDGNKLIAAIPEECFSWTLEVTSEERKELARLIGADYRGTKQAFGALPMGVELQDEAKRLHAKIVNATPTIIKE